jgi:phosphohistidine phosphatase
MALQNLLLLRHGEAYHSSPDELRELNDQGHKEVQKTLSKAADHVPELDKIFHSGLVRAMQTAEIAAEHLATHLQPQFLEGISPWGDPAVFCNRLATEEAENILVVTHNPFVEDLVEYLTGQSLRIKTGSLVCLSVDFLERGCCTFEWVQA